MGLFDRFRTLVGGREPADDNGGQNALGLIAEGNAHEDDGQLEEAMRCYEAAIRLAPNLARAHLNRGNVLLGMDDVEGALAAYATALALSPDSASAHFNTGNALRRIGRRDAALTSYRRAVELQPDFVDAELALGEVLKDLGQIDNAVVCYYRVLKLKPSSMAVCVHVGNMLREAGQFEGAAESYRQALQLEPDSAEAHCYLGNVLQKLGQFESAVISYGQALRLKPDLPEAHNNLGVVQKELGLPLDIAAASYRRALEIKPDFAEAHINLGTALLDIGTVDDAVACYQRALEINPSLVEARSHLLFIHNYQVGVPGNVLHAEAVRYGEFVARDICPYVAWENPRNPSRRLRVGIVSGDLRQHPVGNFLDGVLAALMAVADRSLAISLYTSHTRSDEITERMKLNCHGWRAVAGLSDENLARQIREDGIDILVDLSGHTPYNRLSMFALKPAPVQVSWLGYFATTGVAEIDYLIADPWTLPDSEEINFTEKIWRLPETRLCFTAPDVALEIAPLPALGHGYITFGCFNNLTKMNDAVVALWAQVLLAVPNSRLFLKAKQLNIDAVQQRTFERFAVHGIGVDRLILEGPVPRAEYLAAYQRVDVMLDPFPYTGGTTTVEALWMGVPVLTLAGRSFLSRQGVGLLMNAGLPEWIAEDHDDYVARAVSHTTDLQALSSLRSELRQRVLASPIFDAPRFAQHFETALRGMWQKWCTDNASSSVQSGVGVSPRDAVCVPIVNNVFITVPASSKHMTTFILQEQHDWFEDEIKFVRHFIKPGMRVVDIGANYGVYTLSIAKIVGDSGRVWAFEPTEATANCLSSSISRNEFVNVELIRAGLSDRCGEARFFTSPNSELNSLSQVATGSDQFETVELLTLDSSYDKFGWDRIDFIKLDAEGEEVNILKGGQAFLSSASPLIMYELKHGSSINLPLINSFEAMGYESYRLLPALNILVPFDQHQAFDGYLLNLFACKQDRASQLERDGVLVRRWEERLESNSANTAAFISNSAFGNALGGCGPSGDGNDLEIYSAIVDSYLMAFSVREKSADKVGYLMGALSGVLRMISQGEQSVVRLITFSRIAFAAGERALGVGILSTVSDKHFAGIDFEIRGPLLPATEKYDNVSPEGGLKAWMISSALEQWLNKSAFSVYFAGEAALRYFSELNKLGFMDNEMKRRYQLLQSNLLH